LRQILFISFNTIMSAWNDFVKKIYWENKKKNKNFQFKDALREASRRKGEMGSSSSSSKPMKSMKMGKSMKSKKCCPCPKKRKTRKNRKSSMFF
jgi:hypothetical protein